jgi:hypothetical protein
MHMLPGSLDHNSWVASRTERLHSRLGDAHTHATRASQTERRHGDLWMKAAWFCGTMRSSEEGACGPHAYKGELADEDAWG